MNMWFASKGAENGYDIMKKQGMNAAMWIGKCYCNVLTITEGFISEDGEVP